MIKDSIVKKLNQQMNLEFDSASLYLQMSAWCSYKGFEGSAMCLKRHAQEEMQHMQRMFDYLCDINQQPIVDSVKKPQNNFESLIHLFEKTYNNEKIISMKINDLCDLALTEKDFSTFEFLQWYVSEQHEEEKLFKSIVAKLNLVGSSSEGLFLVDKELKDLNEKIEQHQV
ncbi:non-heme ferritin [Candidatus Williamhamiltonella defendens]|uniref:non-heme ferritin n=1 Tax=Candidatus Williamhamiltonella defendens TaxID=138072 RepID=UPI00130EE7A7|nr:non-heme ferritin [Candidatus Hamiltonella defensa]